ncbi:hypothetical protein KKB40_06350 [Patescibacteria group bacterium]|nr:hypothetical protein [Patescibacteria group bacterium]
MKEKEPTIKKPEYRLSEPNTLLFLTGAPVSGKSTIAPLVTSSIESLTLQPMDIIRLLAQEIENVRPEKERNPFVNLGSCDSYTIIENGGYSPERLIQGFNAYSKAVSSLLTGIIPKLEAQGVRDLLFEGVQLTPEIVAPYLDGNNRLIVVTSNQPMFASNRRRVFGTDHELLDRYSDDKLLAIQHEIIRQAKHLPENRVLFIDNTGEYIDAAIEVIHSLRKANVIQPV